MEKAQHKCIYILVDLQLQNTIAVQHLQYGPAQPLRPAGLTPGDRPVWLKPRGTHLTNQWRDRLIRCSLMIALLERQQGATLLQNALGRELVALLQWAQVLPVTSR